MLKKILIIIVILSMVLFSGCYQKEEIDLSDWHQLCINADNITINKIDYNFIENYVNTNTICFWFRNGELYIDGIIVNEISS